MMILAVIFGVCAAVAFFVIRLVLPLSIVARYDRGVLALFRWISIAGMATVVAIGCYALLIAS